MSTDKLSNEEYFKAHTELYLLTKDIRSDEERKEIAAHMWNLHKEVKDRIDQTEELPFGKEVCICECFFPDIDNPNVRIGLCGKCHRPIR